jgi:small neutral amino acid transporter SnatA (MarC family)
MIFPCREGVFGDMPDGDPLVVPLAVPLIAGPSALATILVLVAREPQHLLKWFIALCCAWVVSAIILLLATPIGRVLGSRGLVALERLMGMVLTTIAVQMLLDGVERFVS